MSPRLRAAWSRLPHPGERAALALIAAALLSLALGAWPHPVSAPLLLLAGLVGGLAILGGLDEPAADAARLEELEDRIARELAGPAAVDQLRERAVVGRGGGPTAERSP